MFNFTFIAAIMTDLCQNISPSIYTITPIAFFKSLFSSMLRLLTENSQEVLLCWTHAWMLVPPKAT